MVWTSALVTVAALFTLVAFHVFAVQSAFTLENLSKQRTNEQLRYERLREQVASLSSAETVIAAARRLGMVPGARVVYLDVPPAAPVYGTPDSVPGPLSTSNYSRAKPHLGANP